MTSKLARLSWCIASWLWCLGLFAGCSQSEAPSPPVASRVGGYWLQPFTRGSRLEPCGHGSHVWVWTPGRAGLGLVDAEGREVVSVSLEGDPPMGRDEETRVVDVVPTADAERAWVHVQRSSPWSDKPLSTVYAVDHQGHAQPLDFLPPYALELVPSEGHERLWAVSSLDPRALWVVEATGDKRKVDLGVPGQAAAAVSQMLPVGQGEQGWLVLDQSLYQVEPERPRRLQPQGRALA